MVLARKAILIPKIWTNLNRFQITQMHLMPFSSVGLIKMEIILFCLLKGGKIGKLIPFFTFWYGYHRIHSILFFIKIEFEYGLFRIDYSCTVEEKKSNLAYLYNTNGLIFFFSSPNWVFIEEFGCQKPKSMPILTPKSKVKVSKSNLWRP